MIITQILYYEEHVEEIARLAVLIDQLSGGGEAAKPSLDYLMARREALIEAQKPRLRDYGT